MTSPTLSRRQLLRRLGAMGASTAAAPWLVNLAALAPARAATTSGYRALVCLFMYGGNDAYNTVLPTDSASWAAYLAARNGGADPIALPAVGTPPVVGGPSFNAQLGGVLPITPRNPQGRTFALHPVLGALQGLFAGGRLGIVANVGPMIKPTAKTDILGNTAVLPPKLFSHNDQQSVWQSMQPEGSTVGWGGAMADRLASGNANLIFTSVAAGSPAVWLAGNSVRAYSLGANGPVAIGNGTGTLFGSTVAQQQLVSIMSSTRQSQYFETDHTAVVTRSVAAANVLGPIYPAAGAGPWGTANLPAGGLDPLLSYRAPSSGMVQLNPIAAQLQSVARMIAVHAALGMGRQIYFVGVQGFDTHITQNTRHADMLAQVAQAMSYWDSVTRAMAVDQMVTLFTASDFGRAFPSNGSGSDHGWGGHHFVLGGAVNGGDIYGRFPSYGLTDGAGGFLSNDQLNDGVLLPAIPVEQYAATLGTWMGLAGTDLSAVMPNLANWNSSSWNLGFLKA